MYWNDGLERKKHQAELDKEVELLKMNGNTDEEIAGWIETSWADFREQRINAIHTQSLNVEFSEDEAADENCNPLQFKFIQAISTVDEYEDTSEFGWIESIENQEIYVWLKGLSRIDKLLITEMVMQEKI